ncbi:MAG TPA: GIY-YIG nuclease [Legionellales bacterium]|nr:GIY-YIG nuclease [Legionellales bacterium]|tara:strand:+ start:108 stop:395 length:288 start_codon:yes stop_codon:yes gene_type:complete
MQLAYVYMLASQRNGTLYVGSTVNLIKRIWEHKNEVIPGFTAKYKVHMLVYYEAYELYVTAARREKRFKNWPRQWKINLIEESNPQWHDLYNQIC